MNILYIGNKLAIHGASATGIDTVGPLFEKEGHKLFYASSKKNIVLRMFSMIYKTLKYRKIVDFVIIDTYSNLSFYGTHIIGLLCYLFKLKYIPILHGGDLPNRLDRSPKIAKRVFLNSHINVAPSLYLKEAFQKRGFASYLIYNNIEIANYEFFKRDKISPNILFVRAIQALYNPQMAIKVLKELKPLWPGAKLCMVGPDKDGSTAECISLARELGVADDVEFKGKMEKEAWHHLSKQYDIFINTTNVDNTPVSVIEAMALGLPIVTTNVGGLPYLCEDGKDALMVDIGDVKGMTEAINRLLSDRELAHAVMKNARAKAENFDWDKVKVKWEKVFNNEIL